MYRYLLKPFLFLLPPEVAHHLTVALLRFSLRWPFASRLFGVLYSYNNESLHRRVFGLDFKNPIGLAAGFDKDGKYYREMAHLGFGFIEIGTVTPEPQPGNPQPRLFRLPHDKALINRMGFNNEGVDTMVKRLKHRPKNLIIGGNIGKNKSTPNKQAVEDYALCFTRLFDYVDYFVVNVSSPNTPGLRELQDKEPLTKLLSHLQDLNDKQLTRKPLLLKIAPDLSNAQLDDILDIAKTTRLDGFIATNTTIERSPLDTDKEQVKSIGAGGLSGVPLKDRSTDVIRYLHEKSNGNIPIVGAGGIDSPAAALEKLRAGASLLQVYTGLVYEGPGLVKRICKAIAHSSA